VRWCVSSYPPLCLLVMLLHHTPLAENSWAPIHDLLHHLSMFLDIFFTFPTGILNRVSLPLYQILKICLSLGLLTNSLIIDLFYLCLFIYMHMFDPLKFSLTLIPIFFVYSVRIQTCYVEYG
jgi:hypothetical protein